MAEIGLDAITIEYTSIEMATARKQPKSHQNAWQALFARWPLGLSGRNLMEASFLSATSFPPSIFTGQHLRHWFGRFQKSTARWQPRFGVSM